MTPVRHQREVENRLRDAVRQDRARIQIGRISRFGLLEMSRQRLSPSLGESSHHVCPRCNGTGTIRDNESLALSILRLIEEEALKENTKEVHAIVPVQVASYLLNEKRESVSAIEKRQGGVKAIIVPNDQMQTPHYSVLRVRKGEETPTLSYLLPKLHEEEMAQPLEDAPMERKRPEQPALASFSLAADAPPPAEEAVATQPAVAATATKQAAPAAAKPGLLGRLFGGLKALFAGEEQPVVEAKPVVEAPKTESHGENRRQDRRGQRRQGTGRKDRGERGERSDRPERGERKERGEGRDNRDRDNREPRENREPRDNREGRETREVRDEQRRNRRNAQQTTATVTDEPQSEEAAKAQREEQQQRREQRAERQRRRQEEKRQAQQEVAALESTEAATATTASDEDHEERQMQNMQRRQRRPLSQKVRVLSAEEELHRAAEELLAPKTPVAKAPDAKPAQAEDSVKLLPETVEAQAEDDAQGDNRANGENGMPRRSRRSPRHLRVSGQRRRRYRDERYPTQSPMPLAGAFASPEMASGKVWVSYPVTQAAQVVEEAEVQAEASQIAADNVMAPEAVSVAAPVVAVVAEQEIAPVNQQEAVADAVEAVVEEAQPVVETAEPIIAAQAEDTPVAAETPAVEETAVVEAAVVAEETPAVEAAPAVETAPEVEETPVAESTPVLVVEETATVAEVVTEPAAPVVETAPVQETVAPAVVEKQAPAVQQQPAPVQAGTLYKHIATAPMTKAPAPDYVPEQQQHSDWQRPSFAFEGKGSAGGHAAVNQATAPATKPQPVNE